jgi:hypothetical protein
MVGGALIYHVMLGACAATQKASLMAASPVLTASTRKSAQGKKPNYFSSLALIRRDAAKNRLDSETRNTLRTTHTACHTLQHGTSDLLDDKTSTCARVVIQLEKYLSQVINPFCTREMPVRDHWLHSQLAPLCSRLCRLVICPSMRLYYPRDTEPYRSYQSNR